MIDSGIYYIVNKVNNNFYIGCTTSFYKREKQHFNKLKQNKHHSQYLQNAYNKYGKNNFEFVILDEIENLNLLYKIESDYIEEYKPKYNMTINKIKYKSFSENICPKCKSKLKILTYGIVNFLKSENTTRECINVFCDYQESPLIDFKLKPLVIKSKLF